VTDGELSTAAGSVSVLVTASTPEILSQPDGSDINVPLGAVNYEVVILATGMPRPTYQWQNLTLLPLNITTNSTSNSTATSMVRRSSDEDQSYYIDWAPQHRVVRANNDTYAEVHLCMRTHSRHTPLTCSVRCRACA
jgi:hypothetical protein